MNKIHNEKVVESSFGQTKKRFCFCGVLLIMLLFFYPVAFCPAKERDSYPSQKINWLIPYKAGGGFDLVARGIAPYLNEYLQNGAADAKGGGIVMRNEPASGGRKAYSVVYNAKPDGYTIGAFDIGFIAETFLNDVGFDISKFTFLVRAMKTDRLIVTNKHGFANWEEMIKASKIKPLKWGTGAFLQSMQLDSTVLTDRFGIPVRFIPWGGGTAESMNALMRGDVQVAMVSDDSVKGLLDAGEIRPLAVISEKSKYPGVPSIKDLGHPDLAEKLGTQRFVIAPPGLPGNIKSIFISAFKKAMNDRNFLSYTKKLDLDFNPLYGDDADKAYRNVSKYYQNDLKPLYIKYSK